jgi:prolyl-tRNA synthetase
VPIRIELGPKDLEKGQVCVKMRTGSDKKEFIAEGEFLASARQRLLDYQDMLLARAREQLTAGMVTLDTWEQFEQVFANEDSKFAWCHWDGTAETEKAIKEKTKVTIRCIPLPGQGPEPEPGTCIFSGKPSPRRVLMAKAY